MGKTNEQPDSPPRRMSSNPSHREDALYHLYVLQLMLLQTRLCIQCSGSCQAVMWLCLARILPRTLSSPRNSQHHGLNQRDPLIIRHSTQFKSRFKLSAPVLLRPPRNSHANYNRLHLHPSVRCSSICWSSFLSAQKHRTSRITANTFRRPQPSAHSNRRLTAFSQT